MKSYLDQDNIKAINNYIQAKPVKRDYKGLIVLCLIAVCALVVGTIEMGAL